MLQVSRDGGGGVFTQNWCTLALGSIKCLGIEVVTRSQPWVFNGLVGRYTPPWESAVWGHFFSTGSRHHCLNVSPGSMWNPHVIKQSHTRSLSRLSPRRAKQCLILKQIGESFALAQLGNPMKFHLRELKFRQRKRHININLFGPVALGTTPGLSLGQTQLFTWTNPGFLLVPQFVPGTNPVCFWTNQGRRVAKRASVLKVYVPLSLLEGTPLFGYRPCSILSASNASYKRVPRKGGWFAFPPSMRQGSIKWPPNPPHKYLRTWWWRRFRILCLARLRSVASISPTNDTN